MKENTVERTPTRGERFADRPPTAAGNAIAPSALRAERPVHFARWREAAKTLRATERTRITMPTTGEENKTLARRFGEAITACQYDLLDELVASDSIRHCQATPEVNLRGLEQFKDFLKQDTAAFPGSTQTLTHVLAEGDLVAVWGTYEGTQTGQMGSFPPSGKRMRVGFGAILRVENGKIAEMWVTRDNIAALAQLGHLAALVTIPGEIREPGG